MCQYNPAPKFSQACPGISHAPIETLAKNEALGKTRSSMESPLSKRSSGERPASGRIREPYIQSLYYLLMFLRDTKKNSRRLCVSRDRHYTSKLPGKSIASQGSRHRDWQPCLTQALRRIMMAMVEQMVRRPGNTKPAVADNPHRLFRCNGGSEIGPQVQIPSCTDLKPERFSRRLLCPFGPDRLMNPDFDDAFRRPQERTEHPCKTLTLFQKPRTLSIAPFFIGTWISWGAIGPGDTVVIADIQQRRFDRQRDHRMRSVEGHDN
jgi:hypothetical protein